MNKTIISINPPEEELKLNVKMNDHIVVHCLDVESFMPMSVVIVMKSSSVV